MARRYHPWMRRSLAIAVAVAAALSSLSTGPAAGSAERGAAAAAQLAVDCQPPSDECWPIAFAFTPNGRELFYLERYTGEVHRVRLGTGKDQVWGSVGPVEADGEQGALGLAVDPRWNKGKRKQRRKNRWVYVFYTNASPRENRVVRLRQRLHASGVKEERLLTISIETSATNHNAGVIAFGPDGKLYVATGDQAEPSRSQDLGDPAGKMLRLQRTGARPGDNPIPGSPAFSFGHRNSFGFAFDPFTGGLWQSENGPNCDEINFVQAGRNYGWGPGSSGSCPTSTSGPNPTSPEREYEPAFVPTAVSFCRDCGLGPDVEGDLLLGTFEAGEIRNYDLDAERDDLGGETVLLDRDQGILAMVRRPNGQVWFSDRDGIYRLVP